VLKEPRPFKKLVRKLISQPLFRQPISRILLPRQLTLTTSSLVLDPSRKMKSHLSHQEVAEVAEEAEVVLEVELEVVKKLEPTEVPKDKTQSKP